MFLLFARVGSVEYGSRAEKRQRWRLCLFVVIIIIPIGLSVWALRGVVATRGGWRDVQQQQQEMLWDVLQSHLKANKMKMKQMFFLFFFFLFASVHTPPHQRRLVSGARVGGSAVVTRWAPFYAPTTFSIPCELFVEFFFAPFILFFFPWNLLYCYNIRHSQWFRFFSEFEERKTEDIFQQFRFY